MHYVYLILAECHCSYFWVKNWSRFITCRTLVSVYRSVSWSHFWLCLPDLILQSLPFGGVKDSGFGRFAGIEGLRACCLVKSVVEDRWWPYVKTKIPKPIQVTLLKPPTPFITTILLYINLALSNAVPSCRECLWIPAVVGGSTLWFEHMGPPKGIGECHKGTNRPNSNWLWQH